MKEPHPLSFIAVFLIATGVLILGFRCISDTIAILTENRFFEGWRYLIVLAIAELLFSIAALLYLFRKKWWAVLLTIIFGALVIVAVGLFPFAFYGTAACFIITVLLIAFRKKFIS